MRVFVFFIILCCTNNLWTQQDDPVLFSVDEEDVHLSEFIYIYEKNNAANADYSKASLEDYLELYKKFKLKVHKARDMGLDTVKSLQDELAGYRKQLARSYLRDREINAKLIDEVVERMAYDVEVSHIFVSAPEKSPLTVDESAKLKINEIYLKLEQGAPFDLLAKTLSEDKVSAPNNGYLGFYTAPLPSGFYEFENAMYSTSPGNYSQPVKSKMGYHIVMTHDIRPARGQVEIAHILIRKKSPERMDSESRMIADSVYQLLLEGRNYENMAGKFSEDSKTKSKGGYLGYLGINQYEKAFEDAAFGLKENGQFSEPVETKVGFHIIKRINKRDDSDKELVRKRIRNQISNNDRFDIAQENLIEEVKMESGFHETPELLDMFVASLDEDFFTYKWQVPEYTNDAVLFTLAGQNYHVTDFANFVKENVKERLRYNQVKSKKEAVDELYDMYVDDVVMAYEEKNLENKYPDFKSLMREYREGILLFEITKQEVWDKAAKDTTGLKAYYAEHKEDYIWPERVRTIEYTIESTDERAAISIYKYAQKKDHEKTLNHYKDVNDVKIKTEELILDKGDKRLADMELEKGALSPLQIDRPSAVFLRFKEMVPPEPKTLEEAKGYVIADYQDYLEKQWIERLSEEFKIKVNKNVLKSITQ